MRVSTRLSPTSDLKKLPRHGGCPRRLWYEIHGGDVRKNRTDTSKADIGTLTHALLEAWMRKGMRAGRKKGGEFDPDCRFVPREEASLILSGPLSDLSVGLRGEGIVQAVEFFETGRGMIRNLKEFRPYLEPEATLYVPHRTRSGTTVMVKGVIDACFTYRDEGGDTRLVIADFKTGQSRYEDPHGRPQFSTYVWMFDKLYGHGGFPHVPLVDRVMVMFLRERKLVTLTVGDDFTDGVEDDIEAWFEETRSTDQEDYPREIGGLCQRWCPYSGDCIGKVMGRSRSVHASVG